MAGKKILYQDDARRALINGMDIMVEAVSVTLRTKRAKCCFRKDMVHLKLLMMVLQLHVKLS